jgi:hypothetical protein
LYPTAANKDKFTKYRNKIKSSLKNAEKRYYADKIKSHSGDLTKTWKTLNELLNRNKSITPAVSFDLENGVTSDPKKIAE